MSRSCSTLDPFAELLTLGTGQSVVAFSLPKVAGVIARP
jgi:hypothetical protein